MRGSHLVPAARGLTFLRVLVGGVMLLAGGSKMVWSIVPVVSIDWQRDFPLRLAAWLADHPSGIAAAVVRDLLIPHGALFAGMMAWTQVLTGLLLLVGLFTRFAAFVACGVLGMLALVALTSGNGAARFYVLLAAVALALLIGDAGQTMGVDGARRERRD